MPVAAPVTPREVASREVRQVPTASASGIGERGLHPAHPADVVHRRREAGIIVCPVRAPATGRADGDE